jgi:hypothetical protein
MGVDARHNVVLSSGVKGGVGSLANISSRIKNLDVRLGLLLSPEPIKFRQACLDCGE